MRRTRALLVAAVLAAGAPWALAADDPAAQALAAARRGELDAALQASEVAVAQRPSAATWNVRAWVLSTAGRKEEALAAYAKAEALDPRDLLSRMNRGSVLLSLGRPQEALVEFDAALRIDPNHARAHNHRGVAL